MAEKINKKLNAFTKSNEVQSSTSRHAGSTSFDFTQHAKEI
jgi:hypothetical protein